MERSGGFGTVAIGDENAFLGTNRWAIRLTAAMSMILRLGLVEGGGQITTRALSSSNIAACPPYVLPTPQSLA